MGVRTRITLKPRYKPLRSFDIGGHALNLSGDLGYLGIILRHCFGQSILFLETMKAKYVSPASI